METIFRWLAGLLAGILERYADPDLDAKLKAFNDKLEAQERAVKIAEELARQSEASYRESVKRRDEWAQLLSISEQEEKDLQVKLVASQERVKQIEDEATKLKSAIDARSDRDVLREQL